MSTISLNENSLAAWQEQRLEHIRYEYELTPDSRVIDLGAYQGEWANEIFARYGCKIVAVEPTEYILGFKNGIYVNKAASTHKGKMSFGGRAYYTSTFEAGDHEYDCFDVNGLIEQYEVIDLLKMNIEGTEYDVLNHIIDGGMINRIGNIQVQFHQIEGVPYDQWYKELVTKLSETHSLTWRYPFCWENYKRND